MTPRVNHLNLRQWAFPVLVGALLGASACAALYTGIAVWEARGPDTEWVQLPDGRSVLCVVDGTGFDCDWRSASLEGEP